MDADGSCSSVLILKTKLISMTMDASVSTDASIL